MDIKQQIRSAYKQKRNSMSDKAVTCLSAQIADTVTQWEIYQQAEAVYFYYPLGNEVSLLPVIKDAFYRNKKVAFPKVSGKSMEFYQVFGINELKEGTFHVMEPYITGRQPVYWNQALCFVPGVVFDKSGGRFGYGKGFYDRYFSLHTSCHLIGCAYECQVVEKLPLEMWDRHMDALVTETGIRIFIPEPEELYSTPQSFAAIK